MSRRRSLKSLDRGWRRRLRFSGLPRNSSRASGLSLRRRLRLLEAIPSMSSTASLSMAPAASASSTISSLR